VDIQPDTDILIFGSIRYPERPANTSFMNKVIVSFAAVLAHLITPEVYGQIYSIADGEIQGCSGVLEDTGGPIGEYGPNESHTVTICPTIPNAIITLHWVIFDLSQEGSYSTRDRIEIWNGSSTNSSFLGTFYGSDLQGLIVAPTESNTSGCLTVRFTSNDVGQGNFTTVFGCSPIATDCLQPVAVNSTDLGETTVVCIGDTLFLDGSNSIAPPGDVIVEWIWYTGITPPFTSNSPIDTLVITASGVLALQLQVRSALNSTSNSICTSALSEPNILLVSGPVTFSELTAPGSVCIPDTALLIGSASLSPFVHTTFTGGQFGPGLLLPDLVGIPFISTAVHSGSPPGSIITDPAQLGDICLDLEHSFMGDFLLQLECPNGQRVTLHQQGGAGTYLGNPVEGDENSPTPGLCWQYCFSTAPDHGTWVECSASGATPNVTPIGYQDALSPGTYSSLESLDSLIGCPFNGEWSITFIDLWGSDNGYLCSWSLGFTVEVDSSWISYTGTIDLSDPQSTFWTGPDLIGSEQPVQATVPIGSIGANDYTFTIIDSYGCVHDTTMTISGYQAPLVDAGDTVTICDLSAPFNSSYDLFLPSCSYRFIVRRNSTSTSIPPAMVRLIIGTDTLIHVYGDDLYESYTVEAANGSSISILYENGPNNNSNRFTLNDANGNTVFDSGTGPLPGTTFNGTVDCSNVWSPDGFVSWTPQIGIQGSPASGNSTVSPPGAGWYTLTAGYPNGCQTNDSVWVENNTGFFPLSWDAESEVLCAETSHDGPFSWYSNGSFYANTPSNCLSNPSMNIWHVIIDPEDGCVQLSDTILTCHLIELQLTEDLSITTGEFSGQFQWTFNGTPVTTVYPHYRIPFQGEGLYTVIRTIWPGCTATDSLLVLFTGLEATSSGFTGIVPNPTSGTINIYSDASLGFPSVIRVVDVSGRVVMHREITNWTDPQTLYMEHCEQGTYFIEVFANGRRSVSKLLLER
jgi:hypothetical protein